MRLGGPVFQSFHSPDEWVNAVKSAGYRAAYCPLEASADSAEIREYSRAATEADLVIAEVGAWSNPLSPDETERKQAREKCQRQLDLADQIGARCCVNIAGSRGPKWDGPCALDLTAETFEMIVATVREIIDAVRPTRTFYTLETMPWMYPDSADSYLKLIQAIDRPAIAVHLDPVNLISSPQRYFHNRELLRECLTKLGPYLKSCHAKDILLREQLTVHLDEVRPGLGKLDYAYFLHALNQLDPDIPLMLEHLPDENEYRLAADYLRGVERQAGK
jgi:sugar phosphate isomerase/epimerase